MDHGQTNELKREIETSADRVISALVTTLAELKGRLAGMERNQEKILGLLGGAADAKPEAPSAPTSSGESSEAPPGAPEPEPTATATATGSNTRTEGVTTIGTP